MLVESLGYHHEHDRDFIVDRPNGTWQWMLLLIKTPSVFLQNGEMVKVRANSFILYRADSKQYYRATGDHYIDDWLHFVMSEEENESYFEQLGIPLDTVLWLGDISELSALLRTMTYEFYGMSGCREEVVECYLKIFFSKLSNQILLNKELNAANTCLKYQGLGYMRARIYNEPNHVSCINDMAEELGMSRSCFQHSYKKIFGCSIIEDIIKSRLNRAEKLLLTTSMTIHEIGVTCGYKSDLHFIRQFKQKYHTTPTQFRNS